MSQVFTTTMEDRQKGKPEKRRTANVVPITRITGSKPGRTRKVVAMRRRVVKSSAAPVRASVGREHTRGRTEEMQKKSTEKLIGENELGPGEYSEKLTPGQIDEFQYGDELDEDDDDLGLFEEGDAELSPEEGKGIEILALGTFWALVGAVAVAVYVGVYWTNTLVPYHYPRIASPGVGKFVDTRYNFYWFAIYALIFNALPPIFLQLAVAFKGRITGIFLHQTSVYLAGLASLFSVIALGFVNVCFYSNTSGSALSLANDYRWCGVFYSSAPDICANVVDFVPNVVAADLSLNTEMKAHIFFGLGFIFYSLASLFLNYRIRDWSRSGE